MTQYVYLSEDKTLTLNFINVANDIDVPFDLTSDRLVKLNDFEFWDAATQSVKKFPQADIDLQLALAAEMTKVQNRFGLLRQQQQEIFAIVENNAVVRHGSLQALFPDAQLPIDTAANNAHMIIQYRPFDAATQTLEVVEPYFEAGYVYSVKVVDLTSTQIDEAKFAELVKVFELAVIQFLNAKVQERNYDNILSACTYDNSTIPKFKSEALACIAWRDAVWEYCYSELNKVKLNQRQINTPGEFINELPVLIWP